MDICNQQSSSNKKVFETEWFTIEAIPYESLNNKPYYRLSCNDSVSIIAKTTEGKIILVRQYRTAIEDFTLEMPSGYIDEGESPEDAIKRELKEETRYVCDSVAHISSLKICPSRINNTHYVFFGKDARLTETKENEKNKIELVLVTQEELNRLILTNEFVESSGMAVFLLAQLRGYL